MILLQALALVQSASTATATTTEPVLEPLPQPVQAAMSAYEDCLMDVIDEQDRRTAYSERAVISACASIRRARYGEAIARLNDAGWSAESSRRRIHQRFAELDEAVWTIVGHVRERHGRR